MSDQTRPSGENLPRTALEALEKLKAGNRRFIGLNFAARDWQSARTSSLNGQNPYAIILTCSDSRVSPKYIFDAGPGDLFVVQVAGNVISPVVLGSIEYAAAALGVRLLLVLGHEKCGAVEAAVNAGGDKSNINSVLERILPVLENLNAADYSGKAAFVEEAVTANAKNMASRILLESTVINQLVNQKDFLVVSGKYFLEDGRVDFF